MQGLTLEAVGSLQRLVDASKYSSLDMTLLSMRDRDIEALQDRFGQWAANIGALQPPTSPVSLNHRLRNTPATASAIGGLLTDLSISANRAADIASGRRPNRVSVDDTMDLDADDYDISSSDSDSSTMSYERHDPPGDGTTSEFEELINAVKISLNNLFKAAALISRLSVKTRRQRARNIDPYPCEFDAGFIRDAFPYLHRQGTPKSEALILRLAEANARRRQYFKYCRKRHGQLSLVEEIQQSSSNRDELGGKSVPAMTVAKTEATYLTTDPSSPRPPKSGRAKSAASQTSISTSIFNAGQKSLNFPKIPDEANVGESFVCPYCMTFITLRPGDQTKRWYEHVLADLEPYICTFLACSLETSGSFTAWSRHELQQHRRRWECSLSGDQEDSRQTPAQHFARDHQSGRSDQISELLVAAAKPTTEIDLAPCPFCGENSFSADLPPSDEASFSKKSSIERFQNHIGLHLQRISLFALPRPDTEDSPSDSHQGRDGERGESIRHIALSVPRPSSPNERDDQGPLDVRYNCFFSVLDPEGTEKLRGTKHSGCLQEFPSVNRLKEHIWRAHSPTHNCVHCRKKATNPTEQFREEHARCLPGSAKINRPMPLLITQTQVAALRHLNQHYRKPNDESIRYKKLWSALFPREELDESRFLRRVPRFSREPPSEDFNTRLRQATGALPLDNANLVKLDENPEIPSIAAGSGITPRTSFDDVSGKVKEKDVQNRLEAWILQESAPKHLETHPHDTEGHSDISMLETDWRSDFAFGEILVSDDESPSNNNADIEESMDVVRGINAGDFAVAARGGDWASDISMGGMDSDD